MRWQKLSQNFYKRQIIINMAIGNTLQMKGLFVYALKGFSLRCRDKSSSPAFAIKTIGL